MPDQENHPDDILDQGRSETIRFERDITRGEMSSADKSGNYYAVIMAGGGGTRLWPLSRASRPKQMLRLIGDESLFQIAVQRLNGIFPPQHIYVVTVEEQAEILRKQCPELPVENFILEPMPRGTASVVGLAAVALQHRDPQAVMAILTADHFIGDVRRFHQLLLAAREVALEGHLVTLGIEPTYPATGYGYIQSGEALGSYQGLGVHRVRHFKEKPQEEQAVEMIGSGDHAWNSGMFVWQVADIMREFKRQMPELAAGLEKISSLWGTLQQSQVLSEVWSELKSETIDFGIMEHARDVAVIPAAGLKWNDVGSWDSLFEMLPADADGNIILSGDHFGMDTRNSLVFGDEDRSRLIVTLGVQNLVIVDTENVLLVCSIEEAQRIREVVRQLKGKKPEYL
jgi:mannose-1-phosphate guanylyltransferase